MNSFRMRSYYKNEDATTSSGDKMADEETDVKVTPMSSQMAPQVTPETRIKEPSQYHDLVVLRMFSRQYGHKTPVAVCQYRRRCS